MDFLLLAKEGRNDWWRILLFILTVAASVLIATFFTDYIDLSTADELSADIFTEGIAFFIALAGVFVGIKLIHKRSFLSLNGVFKIKELFEGIIIWGVLVVVGSLINQQAHWKDFIDNRLSFSMLIFLPVIFICIGIQSYTEEVVFRGYIFQTISLKVKSRLLLVMIGSLLFGVLHFQDGFWAIIGTTIFGCLSCYIVLERNSLSFVTGVHLVNNFFFVYLLADRNPVENSDFFKFDFVEYGIALVQFVILGLYVRFKAPSTS